jgi:hypothetical protein
MGSGLARVGRRRRPSRGVRRALAILDVLFPADARAGYRWITGVAAGAALLVVTICGLVVVHAADKDRWIGRFAAVSFGVAYFGIVLWSTTSGGGGFLGPLSSIALTVGVTATAAYSIRARLARLAAVGGDQVPMRPNARS